MKAIQSAAYPGFDHTSGELSAYSYSSTIGIFFISLKNGRLVRFAPEDKEAFEEWLRFHKIRDIWKDSK